MMVVYDGALVRVCVPVRDWLDMAHLARWIGHVSPVLLPLRSPDLTLLYFFRWVYLKELVHWDVVTTQSDEIGRLHAACTSVDTSLLRCVHLSIPRRAQYCLNIQGGHFEDLPL
ncbi:uncharacterized protein TNCV_1351271 [Trichonephila clavipes]|nr:uncharacterized protein TNCV_1351271 [Trichonephila clavipes]